MQELIDEMDLIKNLLWQEGLKDKSAMISDMIKKAVNKLEKEKEQIIEAYSRAICMFHESEQPEEYYNETFNNLHIVTDGNVGLSNPNETTNNELNVK